MTGVNAVEIRKAPAPDLDPQGAILKIEACGICGTDARTFFNGDPKAPAPWILGHEPVGIIEELGPGAHLPPGVKKGDRVFLGSILTCGQCRWCTEGFQNLCDQHLLYGYDPFPGAYAEVHFKLAGNARSLRLPANTVLFRAPGLQVAIVDAQRRIQLKSIVEGRDFGNTIEILSGLQPDEVVILNPPDSLTDGTAVRIAPASKTT